MRPASSFLFIQLSNAREYDTLKLRKDLRNTKMCPAQAEAVAALCILALTFSRERFIFSSLTHSKRKKRYNR